MRTRTVPDLSGLIRNVRTRPAMRAAACSLLLLVSLACASPHAAALRDFTSDGCSLFPDGTLSNPGQWCDCCFQHDIAYWRGGTSEDRVQADEALRACVLKRTGDRALATIMFDGVRAGGHPAFPAWYRWAYGWSYGRGYAPLSPQEQAQAAEKIRQYEQKHPAGYCRITGQ